MDAQIKRLLLLLAISGIMLRPGYAQENQVDLSLAELTGKEVISASKSEQSSSEALASVIAISAEEIKRYGYRTLAEALQRVVGMYVSDDRTYQYVGIRGLNEPGGFNGRLLFLIDGHKIVDPNYDYTGIGEDFNLDIESISRIEIVKGSGSALWGTNAVVAVINVITKSGRLIDGTSVKAEYGTFDRRKAHIESGGVTQAGVEYAGSFSVMRSSGEKNIYYSAFDSPQTHQGISSHDDAVEAQRAYVKASYQDFNLLLISGIRKKGMSGAAYYSLFDAPELSTDYSFNSELGYTKALSADQNFIARVYHDYIGYHQEIVNLHEDGREVHNQDHSNTRIAGAELRLQGNFSPDFGYSIGTEFQDAYALQIKNEDFEPDTLLYDARGEYRLWSVYTEENYKLLPTLNAVVGGRVDRYSTFGSHFSPRLGIVSTPASGTTLKLLFGGAFRAPDNYERKADDGQIFKGNSALTEESVSTWEFIAQQRIGEVHRLSLSLYRYDVDDLIVQVPGTDGLLQWVNQGTASSRGAELWWNARTSDELLAYGGIGYSDATDGNDIQLVNSPHTTASLGVSIPVYANRIFLSPEVRYQSRVNTRLEQQLPSSSIFNLVLTSAECPTSHIDFSLGIYNLFDHQAYSVTGLGYAQGYAPLPGRQFRLQLGYKF